MSARDIFLIAGGGLLLYAAYQYFSAQAATPSPPYPTPAPSPLTPAPVPTQNAPLDLTLPPITDTQLNLDPIGINIADLFGQMTPAAGGHPGAQSVSENGLAFIEKEEGFRNHVYNDGGHNAIGYGHNIEPGEAFPATITEPQAFQILLADLQPITAAINQSVTAVLTQNMFDALASFAYNVGIGAFQGSTLLQKLNIPDYKAAQAQFSQWANPARRAREAILFLS